MSKPIFALFTRSLRQESRQTVPYLIRILLIGAILVELFFFYAASSRMGAPGLQFFSTVFYTNLVVITLAGISYFSTAITEEKEEMTLGLLRMTLLDPLSILLGKSTVRLIGAGMLLAAQVPFTILAVTLGGVALNQIMAAYLALFAWLIFMSSLGLLWSVVCNKSSTAGAAVIISLVFFFCLPLGSPIISELELSGKLTRDGAFAVTARQWFEATLEANPFKRGIDIMKTGFSTSIFGAQFFSNLALGVILFLAAWKLFEFFTREQKEAAPARTLLARSGGRWRLFSPGRVWRNAVAWKDFYFMAGGWWVVWLTYIVAGLILAGIYWLIWKIDRHNAPDPVDFAFVAQFFAWIIFGLQTLFAAGRVFAEERNWQTWSTLMCLPISTAELARSKLIGIFIGTLPLASVAAALTLVGLFSHHMELRAEMVPILFVIVSAWIFMLHLTMLISLYMKRGAGILTLGICFFGAQFFFGFLMLFSGIVLLGIWATLIGTGVGLLLASAGLHRLVRERLEVMGGM